MMNAISTFPGWAWLFFFRTVTRVCKQSLEIHEMNKKFTFVYQMMIKVHTGSYQVYIV